MDKKTLRQYRYIQQEIDQLEAEKQGLYQVSATRYSDMPKGHNDGGDLTNTVQRIDKLQGRIDRKMDKLIALRIEIERVIGSLQPAERVLMRGRYIEGKSWERVAVEMNYSIQHIWRLHGEILHRLQNERQ